MPKSRKACKKVRDNKKEKTRRRRVSNYRRSLNRRRRRRNTTAAEEHDWRETFNQSLSQLTSRIAKINISQNPSLKQSDLYNIFKFIYAPYFSWNYSTIIENSNMKEAVEAADNEPMYHGLPDTKEVIWVRKESGKYPGKFYYFNNKTGKATWKRPLSVITKNEIGGYVTFEKNNYTLNLNSVLQDILGEFDRQMVTINKPYTSIIWHTHPLKSRPWPSFEDIFTVIKSNKPQASLVFTRWGLWEICCLVPLKPDKNACQKTYEKFSQLLNRYWLNAVSNIFHKIEGAINILRDGQGSASAINSLKGEYGLIKFVSWKALIEDDFNFEPTIPKVIALESNSIPKGNFIDLTIKNLT